MTPPDDLFSRPVVLDASVLINLVVVDDPGAILRALHQPKIVTIVTGEVGRNRRTGQIGKAVLQPFIKDGLLEVVSMDEGESELFLDLVGAASPDDLDDGEAATLACATVRGFLPLIDDGKHTDLTRAVSYRHGVSTIGVYHEFLSRGVFASDFIQRCLYDSLRYARMRVSAAEIGWVTNLLTPSQLADCPSIPPRYRPPAS
jgi:predicted nucleic acid-binding protein